MTGENSHVRLFRSFPPSPVADEADENVLERALLGDEIAEGDAEIAQTSEQRRYARVVGFDVEGVFELVASGLERQVPLGERVGNFRERLLQNQRQPLAAELFHQR